MYDESIVITQQRLERFTIIKQNIEKAIQNRCITLALEFTEELERVLGKQLQDKFYFKTQLYKV